MNLSLPPPSSLPSNSAIGVDYSAVMPTIFIADHAPQHQKCESGSDGRITSPLPLSSKADKHDGRIHSKFSHLNSKIPCSLVVKRDDIQTHQDEKQQEQQSEILHLLREILHVTSSKGDKCDHQEKSDCNFLSPMIKRSKVSVDSSEVNKFSLDDDIQKKCEEGGDCEAMVDTSMCETNTVTPESSSHSMTNQARMVSFEIGEPSVKYTISRDEMTHEEKRNLWLQDEEFALIRLRDGYLSTLAEQQQRQIAAASGKSSDTISPSSSIPVSSTHWICARGLELKMKLRFLRTQSKRLANLEKVLIEQERQWDEHWDEGRNLSPFCYDDEAIAAVCSEISDDCLIHAQSIAAEDRQEVEGFLQVEKEKASVAD